MSGTSVSVNGSTREPPHRDGLTLLGWLRDGLGLTGAKPGCGEGVCGACTVLLDGEPVRACRTLAADAIGHAVTTVEGLAGEGHLHPVQEAFLEVGAFQCGYCTAGMIMSTVALLARQPTPDAGQIEAALDGNVCRCCTYPRIRRAVDRAAELGGDALAARATAPGAAATTTAMTFPIRPARPWDLTDPAARDYFAVLPEGLVVVFEPGPSADPGRWAPSGGAWLHVGADGTATAFTGKVDVGQDNRTALSMRVAEELRVPLAAVRLTMGDTDLSPYDMGTFGSRSMPDAGEDLRQAAAAARETLVRLAAARWEIAPGDLLAAGGRIAVRDGSRSIGYGELVRGLRQVERVGAGATLTPGAAETVVGRPAARIGAAEIVTGRKHYPGDISLPGMLHGAVLAPPVVGATLRSVDVTAAQAMAGVTIVRDGALIAAVAGDPPTAGRALRAIHAEWDEPALPSEADLVAYLRTHPVEEQGWEGPFHREIGDVDAALEAAPVRLEATYTTAYLAHAPLETHVALAAWDGDRLTLWCGTQVPFGVRQQVAANLGMAEDRVRVIVPDTGGGFGGKHSGEIAIQAARLARQTGRPVKVRWNRGQEFTAGHLRPAAVMDVRSGADRDGALTAWEMRDINAGMFGLVGPYDVPHQRLDYQPADSPLRQGSYRALAATANHFARESHMDELADALGVDPLALRLTHLGDARLAAVLRAAAERMGWADRPRQAGLGMGLACGVEKGARVATGVEVRVGSDRRLEIRRVVTAFECGAIVNPDGLTNQIEGATIMGLGAALFEAVHFEAGRITNGSLTDYRVPRLSDVPPLEVVLLDRRDEPSAGAGETPIIAIAPALANAIFAASGTRLRALPLVPDGVVPGASEEV